MAARSERVPLGSAAAGGEEPQPLVEARFQAVESERREPGRGQLDGQRDAVQRPAQLRDPPRVRRHAIARRGRDPRGEQVDGIPAAADHREPGTTYTRSYGRRRRVRLVASTVSSGQPATIRSTQARTPSTTCSQLSRTSSPSLPASEATRASSTDVVRCSRTPTVSATAAVTVPGSVTRTRSANHTPSRRSAADSAATLSANRVLPTPPGPVAVTTRLSARAAARAARSATRPTNGVAGTGSPRRPDRTEPGGNASACRARLRRSGSCSLRSIADTWLSTVRAR